MVLLKRKNGLNNKLYKKTSAFCFYTFLIESDKSCSCMKLMMPVHYVSHRTEAVLVHIHYMEWCH
jgi:hypothetical protein